MQYVEHVPDYIETGEEKKKITFTTLDELLVSDTVAGRFAKGLGKDVERFSIDRYPKFCIHPFIDQYFLMAEMVDGKHWVTGFIFATDEEIKSLNLPQWQIKEKNE